MMRSIRFLLAALFVFALLPFITPRAEAATKNLPDGTRSIADVEYATVGERHLLLDLYLPRAEADTAAATDHKAAPPPLIVWIHGGGWTGGDRKPCPMLWMVPRGYAVASLGYRFSQEAKFPAQIYDCKAAIRFLRARAGMYSYDASRIGVIGASAGGHLSALLGTGNGVKELEGDEGAHADKSSDVQSVCDIFGPTDFIEIVKTSNDTANSLIGKLLGGPVSEKMELAKLASPNTFVKRGAPPFLIIHGEKDPLVPVDQSRLLDAKLRAVEVPSDLLVIPGGGHGPGVIGNPLVIGRIQAFFDKTLRGDAKTVP